MKSLDMQPAAYFGSSRDMAIVNLSSKPFPSKTCKYEMPCATVLVINQFKQGEPANERNEQKICLKTVSPSIFTFREIGYFSLILTVNNQWLDTPTL